MRFPAHKSGHGAVSSKFPPGRTLEAVMDKVRNTINALLDRQRELHELEAIGQLTKKQVREHDANAKQLLTLARKPW